MLVSVASIARARDSAEGQRALPPSMMRLDLLNAVGSSPAAFASPEVERPFRRAKASIAAHMRSCVSLVRLVVLLATPLNLPAWRSCAAFDMRKVDFCAV